MLTHPAQMPKPLPHPAFTTRDAALERNINPATIDSRLQRGIWTRAHPGVYARDTALTSVPANEWGFDEHLAAARLYLGPDAVSYGTTAARLWGIQGVWRRHETVELALPPGSERRQREGFFLHTVQVDPLDVTSIDGHLVTVPARTVTDLLLRLGREEGVAVTDSALHLGLIDLDDFASIRSRMYRRRGAIRAREHLGLARVGAQSPLETKLRLVAMSGDLEPDQLQVPIYSEAGVLLGYGDMGWKRKHRAHGAREWLIAEADGIDIHAAVPALYRDRRRANDFLAQGSADIVRFTSKDLRVPAAVLTVIRQALGL